MHSSAGAVGRPGPGAGRYGPAMPPSQVFLSHAEEDANAANEIRVLIETAFAESRVMRREEPVGDSDVVLLLCGEEASRESALCEHIERAQDRAIPIIPIVHGTQRLEKLSFPIARPVSIERGLEFHDQMFAIKLLLVLQEALGGEPLAGRGSAPRA